MAKKIADYIGKYTIKDSLLKKKKEKKERCNTGASGYVKSRGINYVNSVATALITQLRKEKERNTTDPDIVDKLMLSTSIIAD